MRSVRPAIELTPRDREILRDVVQTFILVGEPVSSRAVAKHMQHGVSAATIRNVMADLEEWGYLEQPHTSAGRVPSSAGYHLYIEALMEKGSLSEDDRRRIDGDLRGGEAEPGRLVALTSQLLSRLSGQIGILVTPAIGDTVLRTVDFVPLSGRRVLCVVVSEAGFVENKLLEVEEELSREELIRISNYLTENFRGKTLRTIRERLLAAMSDERTQVDELLGRAISLAQRSLESPQGPEVLVEGTARLLARPELENVARVRLLLDTFSASPAPGRPAQSVHGWRRRAGGHRRGQLGDLGSGIQSRRAAVRDRRRGRRRGAGNARDLRPFAHGLRAHHSSGRLSGRIPVAGARGERQPIGKPGRR